MGKGNKSIEGLENTFLKRKRNQTKTENDKKEFDKIFDDPSNNNGVTEEDMEFFGASTFLKSESLENVSLDHRKRVDKGKVDRDAYVEPIIPDSKSKKKNDKEEKKEEEDVDSDVDEMDLEEDEEDEDDEQGEGNQDDDDHGAEKDYEALYMQNREHRNWRDQDIIKHRLPIKTIDGKVKKITEIVMNPVEKKEQLPFAKFEETKILTKKEKIALAKKEEKEAKDKKRKEEKDAKERKNNEHKQKVVDGSDDEEDEEEDVEKLMEQEMDIESEDEDTPKKELTEAELYLQTQMDIEKAKANLSELGSKITSDPERHVGLLREMFAVAILSKEIVIKKLGVLSLCAIFKDIIPGYRVIEDKGDMGIERGEDGKLKRVQYSKEVKKAKEFESKLVRFYQNYLVYIENTIEVCLTQQQNQGVRGTKVFSSFVRKGEFSLRELGSLLFQVVKSAATLLVSHPHFNFRTNLVTIVTRFTVYRERDLATLCIQNIRDLFLSDTTGGETSLEVIRCIANVARVTNYMFDPRVIRTFMVLKFNDLVDKVNPYGDASDDIDLLKDRGNNRERKLQTKKDRKDRRKERELEREMKESEAVYTAKEQKYIQTEMLKSIFLTYFRIIKRAPQSLAMTSVLEGLARYSHHISVDFLGDMLTVLSGLMTNPSTTLANALNASITAFKTVKLHGHSLNVDLKGYFLKVYTLLDQLAYPANRDQSLTALTALQLMLGERKQTAVERVAAFIKRASIVSLYTQPNASLAFISFIKHSFVLYPPVQRLIENDGTFAGGQYNPETLDPDHCNPFATALWELSLYFRHWHPSVEPVVKRTLAFNDRASELVGREKTPPEIFELFDISKGGFNPPIKVPKEHPLMARLKKMELEKKNNKKNANKKSMVFVLPNNQYPRSSFMEKITKQMEDIDESSLSFGQYFDDIKNFDKQLKLTRQLNRLKKIKIIVDTKLQLKKKQPKADEQKSKLVSSKNKK